MDTFGIYVQLTAYALVPVVVSVGFYVLRERTKFGTLKRMPMQIIIGIVFGIIACLGTEFGVDVGGAVANARDAAPLCAGLLFGGWAGVIAGVIGGVHRWFAVLWGAGMYSRVACSVSTVLAGVYAAFLHRYMFDEKPANGLFGAITAIVMEVIHLTLLFVTHIGDVAGAFDVIKVVTIPMVVANAVGVGLSAAILDLLKRDIRNRKRELPTVSSMIQEYMLLAILVAYVATTFFVYMLQTSTAIYDAESLLVTNVQDMQESIKNNSDKDLLDTTYKITGRVSVFGDDLSLELLQADFDVAEIHVVNGDGIIVRTTTPEYMGFDFHSGAQSQEFLCLTEGSADQYVQPFTNISYDTSDSSRARKYAAYRLYPAGFVQVGLDLDRYQERVADQVEDAAKNRRIGKNGYILIADGNGKMVSGRTGKKSFKLADSGVDLTGMPELKRFKATVYGEESYCMYTNAEGYYIIGVLPVSEVFEMRNISIYVNSFMEVIAYTLLFVLIFFLIKQFIVRDVRKINASLARITEGHLDEVVDIRTTDEMSQLSDSINTTVDTLKGYIEEAKNRMKKDMDLAKNIQASALPSVFPPFPNIKEFDIYATMCPAKEVGGDFYDFYMVNSTKLAFLIADVSGKGVPAAMFMMRSKTMIKNYVERDANVAEVFTAVNNMLCEGNDAGMFVTAWLGILDITTGHVDYACAGHNPPVICRKGQGYSYLQGKPGFILAGMEGVAYKHQEFDLGPGDKVYLYTDGVTEATSAQTELYGEERLLAYLNEHQDDGVEATLVGVKADVDEFVGKAEQFDDITMVCVRYNGPGNTPKAKSEEV